jgi:hypothetical protein
LDDQSKLVIKVGAFDRRWAFCDEPKFHSIMIVVLLHVSKSSRVLKKVTAYFTPGKEEEYLHQISIEQPAISNNVTRHD